MVNTENKRRITKEISFNTTKTVNINCKQYFLIKYYKRITEIYADQKKKDHF